MKPIGFRQRWNRPKDQAKNLLATLDRLGLSDKQKRNLLEKMKRERDEPKEPK